MLGGLAVTTAWRVASAALKQGVRAARRLVAGIQVAIRVDAPAHHGHYVLPEESEDDDAIDGLLRSFERGGNDWYFWDAPNGEWQASSERKGRPKE
jgi:hypothetical protein